MANERNGDGPKALNRAKACQWVEAYVGIEASAPHNSDALSVEVEDRGIQGEDSS